MLSTSLKLRYKREKSVLKSKQELMTKTLYNYKRMRKNIFMIF